MLGRLCTASGNLKIEGWGVTYENGICAGIDAPAAGQAGDTDGKPTAWEPADLPGGETWELIASGEMQETANLDINKDNNGLPFSLKSAQIFVRGNINISQTSYMRV